MDEKSETMIKLESILEKLKALNQIVLFGFESKDVIRAIKGAASAIEENVKDYLYNDLIRMIVNNDTGVLTYFCYFKISVGDLKEITAKNGRSIDLAKENIEKDVISNLDNRNDYVKVVIEKWFDNRATPVTVVEFVQREKLKDYLLHREWLS